MEVDNNIAGLPESERYCRWRPPAPDAFPAHLSFADVREAVFEALDARSLVSLDLTCKHMGKLTNSRSGWMAALQRDFGLAGS